MIKDKIIVNRKYDIYILEIIFTLIISYILYISYIFPAKSVSKSAILTTIGGEEIYVDGDIYDIDKYNDMIYDLYNNKLPKNLLKDLKQDKVKIIIADVNMFNKEYLKLSKDIFNKNDLINDFDNIEGTNIVSFGKVHCIVIKQTDVLSKANGFYENRLTLAHEFGHYFDIKVNGSNTNEWKDILKEEFNKCNFSNEEYYNNDKEYFAQVFMYCTLLKDTDEYEEMLLNCPKTITYMNNLISVYENE